ncbi:hypothetical protein BHM03_00023747 [Ensete ventricosum]|nr:hypothetical protein BHM03_00023747 [Ensete ventricosum]
MAESKPTMRKPEFTKVDQLRPGTGGHTLTVKVVSSKMVLQKGRTAGPQVRQMRLAECLVGDETGMIVFTARNDQGRDAKVVMKPGRMIALEHLLTATVASSKVITRTWIDHQIKSPEFCDQLLQSLAIEVSDIRLKLKRALERPISLCPGDATPSSVILGESQKHFDLGQFKWSYTVPPHPDQITSSTFAEDILLRPRRWWVSKLLELYPDLIG